MRACVYLNTPCLECRMLWPTWGRSFFFVLSELHLYCIVLLFESRGLMLSCNYFTPLSCDTHVHCMTIEPLNNTVYMFHIWHFRSHITIHASLYTCKLCTCKCIYCGASLIRTPLGQKKVSWLVRCPDFRGWIVHKYVIWDNKCPVYWCVHISGCPD